MKYLLILLSVFAIQAHATTTILANGCRNPKFPSGGTHGGVTYVNYGGATAVGDGVTDDTQALLDVFNLSRGMPVAGSGPSGVYGNPIVVYIPSGTYRVTKAITVWAPCLLFGEPSSPPTVFLDTSSVLTGAHNSGFIIACDSYGHAEYDTNWYEAGSGANYTSANNTFELFIRDINFTVDSGNTGIS